MSRSPRIGFGVVAHSVICKAQINSCPMHEKLRLAKAALALPPFEWRARAAALAFLDRTDGNVRSAGRKFDAFIAGWLDGLEATEAQEIKIRINGRVDAPGRVDMR